MLNILPIMDMLDWNMPPEIQAEGRSLAKGLVSIAPFIQPLTPKYNKNVWENCAIIISERSDETLKPYLFELLEWLQDLNWPGSSYVLDRLKKYQDKNTILKAIDLCVEKAKLSKDDVWEYNLRFLLRSIKNNYNL